MKKVFGLLIMAAGFAIAYFMNFSLISDIIALAGLIIGGKLCAS